jgi:hypothetical protein
VRSLERELVLQVIGSCLDGVGYASPTADLVNLPYSLRHAIPSLGDCIPYSTCVSQATSGTLAAFVAKKKILQERVLALLVGVEALEEGTYSERELRVLTRSSQAREQVVDEP